MISSSTFHPSVDIHGNFTLRWDVPEDLDSNLDTSSRVYLDVYNNDTYVQDLYIKMPTHVEFVTIPADIVQALEAAGNRYEIRVQIRTNDNNNRTYSNTLKLSSLSPPIGYETPALIPYAPNPTNDLTPTLQWYGVSDAVNYRIQVDTSSDFDTTPLPVNTIVSGASPVSGPYSYTPASDLPEGDIFWRVSSERDYSLFSNYYRFSITSTPLDSDNDGLLDNDEVNVYGTDPTNPDTDGDGMPDGWEVQYNLDPTTPDASGDADSDGYSNIDEYRAGSEPDDLNSIPTGRYLYDNFSDALIDAAKWNHLEQVRLVDDARGVAVFKSRAVSGTSRNRARINYDAAAAASSLKADIAVIEADRTAGSCVLARIDGVFYNTLSADPTDATGDIWAALLIGDRGNGLEAWYEAARNIDAATDDWQVILTGDLVTGLSTEVAYTAEIDYDQASDTFTFTLTDPSSNQYTQQVDMQQAAATATFAGAAYSGWKRITTGVGDEGFETGTGFIHAEFDNVFLDNVEYETFEPADSARWDNWDFVREITPSGKLHLAAYSESVTTTSQINIARITPYVEAKMTISNDSWAADGGRSRARIDGYFYNDTFGLGSGQDYNRYEGNIWAQIYIDLYSDGRIVPKYYAERVMDANNTQFQQILSGRFNTPVSLGQTYTIGIGFTGSELVFKLNDEIVTYHINTPAYPAYEINRSFKSRVYGYETGRGYMDVEFDDVYVSDTIDLPNTEVTGTVLDSADSQPVANILVEAYNPSTEAVAGSARTAADGTYTIVGLPPGTYVIGINPESTGYLEEFYSDSYGPDEATPIVVQEGVPVANIDLNVERGAEISGTVKNADGSQSVTDAQIQVRAFTTDSSDACGSRNYFAWAETDTSNGQYLLRGMPVNTDIYLDTENMGQSNYVHKFWKSGGGTYDCSAAEIMRLTAPGEEISGRDFNLELGIPITGTVLDDSQQPIPNLHVYVEADDSGVWGGANTDQNGHYSIAVSAGTYRVRACASCSGLPYVDEWYDDTQDRNAATPVSAGDSGINFELSAGATISGTVYDDSGSTIDGTQTPINVTAFTGDPCGLRWGNYGADIDVNGNYTIQGLPPGTYYLSTSNNDQSNYVNEWWATAGSSYDCRYAEAIIVNPGDTVTNKHFQLDMGGSVSGTMYQADGITPVTDAQIQVRAFTTDSSDACGPRYHFAWAETDTSNGQYLLRGMPVNTDIYLDTENMGQSNYVSKFWNSGGGTYDCSMAEITRLTAPGEEAAGRNFNLEMGIPITGTVYNADGQQRLPNVYVTAEDFDTGLWMGGSSTDAEGGYSIVVPAGNYRVRACGSCNDQLFIDEWYNNTPDRNAATPVPAGASGIDFTLSVGATISGTVKNSDGTVPIDGTQTPINVTAFTGDPCGWRQGVAGTDIDANGNYTIQGLPPGTYYLSTSNKEQSNYVNEWWADAGSSYDCRDAQEIAVNAGATVTGKNFQLDLGGSLSGAINKADPAAQDADIQVVATMGDPCGYRQDVAWFNTTTANGAFNLRGLPAGTYYIQTRNYETSNYVDTWWSSNGGSFYCNYAEEIPLGNQQHLSGYSFNLDLGGSISEVEHCYLLSLSDCVVTAE